MSDITENIKYRKEILAQKSKLKIRIGQKVRFSDEIRPKYLIGLEAEVKKINPKTIVVNVPNEPEYGKYAGSIRIRCPISLLTID